MHAGELDRVRVAGPKAALVLERLADLRRHSLVMSKDRAWLEEITPDPYSLLEHMHEVQLLYRIRPGRYLVAPRGTSSPIQAAPIEFMASLLLAPHGEYYVGYLSSLISHRLTDLHSNTVFAAIRQTSGFREVDVDLPGCSVHVVRLADSRWPQDRENELERVRAIPDSKEFFWRSTLERTLVDTLARPELSAGMETVIGCWARANQRDVDWQVVCDIAARQGKSMVRRVAFVLRLLGLHAIARQSFPGLTGRGASTPLDRSDSFDLDPREVGRDRDTGVLINVPESHLLGWIGAAALP